MTKTKTELLQDIRVVLDQNRNSGVLSGLGDVDTLSIDDIIESKIIDAADAVIRSAPINKLYDISKALTSTQTISQNAPFIVTLSLPSDFLRLIRFQMSGWKYPVYEALPCTAPEYVQCHSEYGVCGTKNRPMLFITPYGEETQRLEAFCAGSASDTMDFLYVENPKFVDNSIKLGKHLVRPTIYYAAYLVAITLGAGDSAEKLLTTCNEMLEK